MWRTPAQVEVRDELGKIRRSDGYPSECAPLSDVAFRLMVHANLWARAQRTPGFVPRNMLPTILPGRSRATLASAAEELVCAGGMLHPHGLWEPREGGWRVHDFEGYGHQNAAEREALASRAGDLSLLNSVESGRKRGGGVGR